MPVRHHRLAVGGVIAAMCHAFLACTLAARYPRHGKGVGPYHGVPARPGRAFAALLTAVALLAAACSGSSSARGSGGSPDARGPANSPSAVSYSHCIRSHGVPNYPDPSGGGTLPKTSAQQLGVRNSQFQAAQQACRHLLPSTGGSLSTSFEQCVAAGNCPQALVRRVMAEMLNFARCMRSHGVPNWPDPTIGRGGAPFFNGSAHGIDDHAPQIRTKIGECERVSPSPVLFG
jgi:hypothetical protein